MTDPTLDALLPFLYHKMGCSVFGAHDRIQWRHHDATRCDCGLSAALASPYKFTADEFEYLALMGVSRDGRFSLGDGAARRVLEVAKKLASPTEATGPAVAAVCPKCGMATRECRCWDYPTAALASASVGQETDAECSPDCRMCSGEFCEQHGTAPCDCDVLDRHTEAAPPHPPETPRTCETTLDKAIAAVTALQATLEWKDYADHIGHGEGLRDALAALEALRQPTETPHE